MFSSLRELTRFFHALTSASRLRIVQQLARSRGELSVGELAQRLGMSQPLVSWHLRDLRRIGLVLMRRDGRQSFCSLNRDRLAAFQALFEELLNPTTEDGRRAAALLARSTAALRRHTIKERS